MNKFTPYGIILLILLLIPISFFIDNYSNTSMKITKKREYYIDDFLLPAFRLKIFHEEQKFELIRMLIHAGVIKRNSTIQRLRNYSPKLLSAYYIRFSNSSV